MGQEVTTPVPISVWATRMVTLSSGAMVSQALISGTMASRYQGWPWIGAALTLRGKWKPSTMAPPTAAALARKSRRLRSTFDVASTVAVIARPPLRLQLGCAVNGRPDTPVGAAAADVAHLGVDLRVGRFRAALEERRRRHDLPRLAVAALGHVVLDPCHLYRVRPIRREPLYSGDRLAAERRHRDTARARSVTVDHHRADAFAVRLAQIGIVLVALDHRPWARQCIVKSRDLIDEKLRIGPIPVDALLDDSLIVAVQRNAGGVE